MIEQKSERITKAQEMVDELFRAFDAKEWNSCRALLMEAVEIEILTPSGRKSGKYAADDLIDRWSTILHKDKKSYRQRGEQTTEIKNGIAAVSSRNYIYHRLEEGQDPEFWEIWGDYTHYLVETESGWKCSGIRLSVPSHSSNIDIYKFLPDSEVRL